MWRPTVSATAPANGIRALIADLLRRHARPFPPYLIRQVMVERKPIQLMAVESRIDRPYRADGVTRSRRPVPHRCDGAPTQRAVHAARDSSRSSLAASTPALRGGTAAGHRRCERSRASRRRWGSSTDPTPGPGTRNQRDGRSTIACRTHSFGKRHGYAVVTSARPIGRATPARRTARRRRSLPSRLFRRAAQRSPCSATDAYPLGRRR